MEILYVTTLQEHYSDLAHHYRRSPTTEKAITHLTAALDLLLTCPETPDLKDAKELLEQLS